MDTFLKSLSDEQLGTFAAIQHLVDCDDKLMDILTAVQYKLYEKAKKEHAEQLLKTNHDKKNERESSCEHQYDPVMENFLASLSDEQLGSFYAVQYDRDCDDKLMDILTKAQYDLYLSAKDELASDSEPTDSSTATYHFESDLLRKLSRDKDFVWLDIWRKSKVNSEMKEFDIWRESAIEDYFLSLLSNKEHGKFSTVANEVKEKELVKTLCTKKQMVYKQWKEKPIPTIPPFITNLKLPENKKKMLLKIVNSRNFEALDSAMENYPDLEEMYQWWKMAIIEHEQLAQIAEESAYIGVSRSRIISPSVATMNSVGTTHSGGISYIHTDSSNSTPQEHVTTLLQPLNPLPEEENYEDKVVTRLIRHDGRNPVRERSKSRPRTEKTTSQHSHQRSKAVNERKQKTTKCTTKEGSIQNDQKISTRPIPIVITTYLSSSNHYQNKIQEFEVKYSKDMDAFEQMKEDSFKEFVLKEYKTAIDVKIGNGLVKINFASHMEERIYNTISNLLTRLRPHQRYQISIPLQLIIYWESLTVKEQLDFQTKWQITLYSPNEESPDMLMKSFVSEKMTFAINTLKEDSRRSSTTKVISFPEELKAHLSINLESGDEKRISRELLGRRGVYINEWNDLYGTTSTITTSSGLITIMLKSSTEDNIHRAQQHIWRKLHHFMKYEKR